MKKIISMVLVVLMLACVNVSAENPITVEVDFHKVQFDVEPVNIDGRVLVPVRPIFESMGATVTWNAETKTVTSELNGTTVVMTIADNTMKINGKENTLDVPPRIIADRTMVPARAAAEAFDGTVRWIATENKVEITTSAFTQKLSTLEPLSCVKKLTAENTEAIAAFNISYFPEYETTTNAADGTDFETVASGDDYCVILGVRSDIYTGIEPQMTDEYVLSVAADLAALAGGTLVSGGVVTISNTQFMKIHYTASGTAEGITDDSADITTYMGIQDGVVYTMTLSAYGDVPDNIMSDLNYMTTTLLIK